MPYKERESEARRIDRLYEEVDEAVYAVMIAAFATGSAAAVVEAGERAKVILAQAYAQTLYWNDEAIMRLYGEENALTATTLPQLVTASETRFYQMTLTGQRRIDELVAAFNSAAARREALRDFAGARADLSVAEVAKEMEATLRTYGITGFTDAAGRRWKLKVYAEMAARTTTMEAELAGVKDRVVASGGDLVEIVGPMDYPDGCPPSVLGGPYSVTGATTEYHGRGVITIDEAIRIYGVFHPRCRHTIVPAVA